MKNKSNSISRRSFIGKTAAATAGLTIVPSSVVSGLGHRVPSDKLNIAGIGVGGMGNHNLGALKATENIVAVCDVDWAYAKQKMDAYKGAKQYWDFRKMYDEMGKDIDAVVVATADHTHAICAANAIEMGKHVYVQKPLTHTVYESRLLTKLAAKHQVATQMGNQGSSAEGVNKIIEWIQNGEIGEVTKVEALTNRPIWPQGLNRPEPEKAPDTINWDLFIGPAKMRPYNSIYTPWNFRGWWDFGTGALGDMACHILHPVFAGLKLTYPTKVQGSSTLLLTDSAPTAEMVKLVYPARPDRDDYKVKLPEVEVTWYDGGLQPMKPEGWPAGKQIGDNDGGVIFHGTKDKLICGCYGRNPWLMSGRVPDAPKTQRRVETTHEMDWVRAAKENPKNRVATKSDFAEAGPFNEMVVMGVLAVRLQALHKELEWDGDKMEFTNISDSDTIKIVEEDRFSIKDGHPTFHTKYTDPINAREFAAEMIKHTYRDGWDMAKMPR